jgi:TonB family protein
MGQVHTEPTSCASAKSADTTVYDTTQLSERPVPRSIPELVYPDQARKKKLKGLVVVNAVVTTDGVVDPASVTVAMRAHPVLDAEAERVILLATFWPGCRDSLAVRSRISVPFDFRAAAARRGLCSACSSASGRGDGLGELADLSEGAAAPCRSQSQPVIA